jgi:serine/threonine-protein kinase
MAVRKVGSARIVREIGRGGMGVVYEGYQEGLDRRVAVKALDAAAARSGELSERFRREGRAYAQISHPAVVTVHDLVEKDDALYLVTEFVDGADLHRVMAEGGALPPWCVAAVGARVAEALEAVHAQALLHRDVKPANVMVSRAGEVKLMDFGIAKDSVATDLTRTGQLVGTPAYVAPELLEGSPADARSDIWSLGVAMYEMAVGTRPFLGGDYHEVMGAVRKGRFTPVREAAPGLPRRLARAIERCLERKASRRWETAGALARELEACANWLTGADSWADRLAGLLAERGLAMPADGATGARIRLRRPGPSRIRRVAFAMAAALLLAAGVYAWAARPW